MSTQKDEKDLVANNDPGANASHIIADAYKDHSKGMHAILFETYQNSNDAYRYNVSEDNIPAYGLQVRFRIHPEENIVEAWDNAGGMGKETLKENYLKLGNPGSYKLNADTGGSQGKGFWAMCCWGQSTVIHSLDQDGNEWCSQAIQQDQEAAVSDIHRVENTVHDSRGELSSPGTYIRIEGVEPQTIKDLANWDLVNEKISRKFAFALASDDVSITYEIVGEGEFTPDTYDIESMLEKGGIVEDVDLNTFHKKGQNRQLKSLHLIDNRRLDNEEPPWEGIAMLKGGEFTNHPYLSVWEYIPNQHPITRKGKLWGWVDASELAPDLEEHGHTGFIGRSGLYKQSGLRDAILEASEEYFHEQTVEDQEEASEFGVETINHYMEELNDIDVSSSGNGGGSSAETTPNEPSLRVNSGKHQHEEGSEVAVSVSVLTSASCDIDNVYIKGEIIKTTTAEGNDTSESVREESRVEFDVKETDIETPSGEHIEIANGKYPTEKYGPGIYTFKASLYQHPNPNPDGAKSLTFEWETALKTKPVLSESKSSFRVGDVETDTSPSQSEKSDADPNGVIDSVFFQHGGDEPWRAKQVLSDSGDSYHIIINKDHPEFKAIKNLYDDYSLNEIWGDVGSKWGFFRIHFNQATNEIEELLEDHNVENSQVRSGIEDIIKERVKKYDSFRKEFVEESPITESIDIKNE